MAADEIAAALERRPGPQVMRLDERRREREPRAEDDPRDNQELEADRRADRDDEIHGDERRPWQRPGDCPDRRALDAAPLCEQRAARSPRTARSSRSGPPPAARPQSSAARRPPCRLRRSRAPPGAIAAGMSATIATRAIRRQLRRCVASARRTVSVASACPPKRDTPDGCGVSTRKEWGMEASPRPGGPPQAREVLQGISRFWWLWLVSGIAWIAVSVVILQFDQASITTVGVIVGLMFLGTSLQQFAIAGARRSPAVALRAVRRAVPRRRDRRPSSAPRTRSPRSPTCSGSCS